ncbi:hypothetical protein CYMTET_52218 [Cymbomonas tetramitiformis]|uniref:Uncharacterized protein n=1 Tax=Cymbomonas tetramitiformis TaxID=36881 RepID=A0AAE0ERB0_9CHLO|nr:hypothetical protein CYMTET_52218 [Cymbomonas tetramitiformis]
MSRFERGRAIDSTGSARRGFLDEVAHRLREEGAVVAPYWPGWLWFRKLEVIMDEVIIMPHRWDLYTPSRLGGSELLGASNWDAVMFQIPLQLSEKLTRPEQQQEAEESDDVALVAASEATGVTVTERTWLPAKHARADGVADAAEAVLALAKVEPVETVHPSRDPDFRGVTFSVPSSALPLAVHAAASHGGSKLAGKCAFGLGNKDLDWATRTWTGHQGLGPGNKDLDTTADTFTKPLPATSFVTDHFDEDTEEAN